MEWFTPIDLYCERLAPGFWAEPFNAVSNIVFVLAAVWGWFTASRRGKLDNVIKLLCVMVASIGVGSFLFHTYANLWSSFSDVISIWSFVALYVIVIVIRLTGKSPLRVGGIAAGVMVMIIGIVWIMSSGSATQVDASPDILNGSTQYAPALMALFIFSVISIRKNLTIRPWIVGATSVFFLSLIARTIDMHLCDIFPLGTHFLWHLSNGVMIALLLQGLIRIERKTA